MDALFQPDGDRLVPTELTRGPWDPTAQHGGPPSALCARAVEQVVGAGFHVARLTVELLRPVPLEPLVPTAVITRPGWKVQLAEASLVVAATGLEVVRARALAIRSADVPIPAGLPVPDEQPPAPPGAGVWQRPTWGGEQVAFHRDGAEHRFVEGGWDVPGPVGVWIRLRYPVVAGEEPSGLQRVVAAADFGNGVSQVLPPEYLFINPDLTVHLARPVVGEWVCLRAATWPTAQGVGLAESALWDGSGRVGRSCQSLLVDRRA